MSTHSSQWQTLAGALAAVLVVLLTLVILLPSKGGFRGSNDVNDAMKEMVDEERAVDDAAAIATSGIETTEADDSSDGGGLPKIFFGRSVYNESDFKNQHGIVPTFWDEAHACAGTECSKVWGPCFPPLGEQDWGKEIERLQNEEKLIYHPRPVIVKERNVKNVDDLCRPGFLIIGQGKCGTSSLYHYLDGHPRVVPASEKQIHYFKYYSSYSMRWYLTHFPAATSFLASGALMTGEASPGYLPYPNVAALVKERLPGTKIICVGRDPLDRAYSSYRYNYVNPAITKLQKGRVKGIPGGKPDEYYHEYLFGFEDMMKAELKNLKECLAPNGPGETGAARSWSTTHWGKRVFEKQHEEGKPKLIDLDGHCYGRFVSMKSPRKQWLEISQQHPEKFLNVPNLHLAQAMIGRSLYTYPLEWWYALFPKEDIYFLCTEEMQDLSGNSLSKVSDFLGLPAFNFSVVVSQGMYNVGGHKGYDEMTTWEEAKQEQNTQEEKKEIPLSPELRKELLDFFKPHNERLFELIGRRCDWMTE